MNDIFIRACRGEKTPYTPIWIMRQAGRYLPEYQRIRDRVDFLTLCKTPELAAEVTIQPLDILGVDAAILFSDILIPLEPMGFDLEFSERIGPVIHNPVRSWEAIGDILDFHADAVPFINDTIRILKESIKVPLIGFSGSPFTLATYVIEGGTSKNFIHTKKLLYGDRKLFEEIIKSLTAMVKEYLLMQVRAGVDAVQIFDTWLGILPPEDISFITSVYIKDIIEYINKNSDIPIIYFPFNCGASLYLMNTLKDIDVFGIDWRIDISRAIDTLNNRFPLQGNLDPCMLFGSQEIIYKNAFEIIKSAKRAKGHIFNLGHGVLPDTPVDNVKFLVDTVHQLSEKERRNG